MFNFRYKKFVIILLLITSYQLLVSSPVFALSKEDEIKTAFRDILDRNPNLEEITEAGQRYPGFETLKKQLNSWPERNQTIQNIYQRALKRDPRQDEAEFLKKVIAPNNLIRKQLFESVERTLAIEDLYLGLLGRKPETNALEFYVKTRSPFQKIKEVLSESAERKLAIEKQFFQRLGRSPTITESDFFLITQKYLDYIGKNTPPTAKAGDNQVVLNDVDEVNLNGKASYDLENDPLTYSWSLVSSPQDLSVSLSSATDPQPKFIVPSNPKHPNYVQDGDYVWQLKVSDGQAESEPAEVIITVDLNTRYEVEMLDLVNKLRVAEGEEGAVILTFDEILTWTARDYGEYMLKNNWFDHLDKEGKNPGDRIKAAGYSYRSMGENIGVVSSNMELELNKTKVKMMYDGLYASPGHLANMVSNKFTELGIGFAVGTVESDPKEKYRIYLTQYFGKQK